MDANVQMFIDFTGAPADQALSRADFSNSKQYFLQAASLASRLPCSWKWRGATLKALWKSTCPAKEASSLQFKRLETANEQSGSTDLHTKVMVMCLCLKCRKVCRRLASSVFWTRFFGAFFAVQEKKRRRRRRSRRTQRQKPTATGTGTTTATTTCNLDQNEP